MYIPGAHVSGSSPYDFLATPFQRYWYATLAKDNLINCSVITLAPGARASSTAGSSTFTERTPKRRRKDPSAITTPNISEDVSRLTEVSSAVSSQLHNLGEAISKLADGDGDSTLLAAKLWDIKVSGSFYTFAISPIHLSFCSLALCTIGKSWGLYAFAL